MCGCVYLLCPVSDYLFVYIIILYQAFFFSLKDPVSDGGPLGEWSVSTMPTLATSAPGYDGESVFELFLCE